MGKGADIEFCGKNLNTILEAMIDIHDTEYKIGKRYRIQNKIWGVLETENIL